MTAMEGITHHIMDKHYVTNNDKQSMPWLASRAWEGNSHIGNRPAQATYYYDWIRSLHNDGGIHNNGGGVERICEIGMNGGHSAIIFLAATTRFTTNNKNNQQDDGDARSSSSSTISNTSANLIMFDLNQYVYSTTAKKYIETMFPGRFTYYPGNSLVTLPQWTSNLTTATTATSPNEKEKCDVFSIDGDHSYEGALQDIRNAALATKKGGYIILDDMNPTSGTRKAFDMAVQVDKIISQPKCLENVLLKVGYDDRTDVTNARSLLISWCSAVVL